MPFFEADVRQLLATSFEEIEQLWDRSPYDETLTYAAIIKEFMIHHAIRTPELGIEKFKAFKTKQLQELAALGFSPSVSRQRTPQNLAIEPSL